MFSPKRRSILCLAEWRFDMRGGSPICCCAPPGWRSRARNRTARGLNGCLSEQSIQRRFLGPKPSLSASELRYLTEVDGHDHYAIVAIPDDGDDRIVAVARFVRRHAPRLHLVSKFHPDANLFLPPPPYTGNGRPRVKGAALPKPKEAVAQATERWRLTVAWYGGGTRQVEAVTGTGHWYKSGQGLVAVRWVYVHDTTGSHRDEYLYTTDLTLTPEQVIGHYTARWNIETTFQELRSYLGLETTQGWCRQTVLRLAPCLFGLYSLVALVYQQLPAEERGSVIAWPGKQGVTFSDALTCVRRWLWQEWVFRQAGGDDLLEKLPPTLKETLFTALAPTC